LTIAAIHDTRKVLGKNPDKAKLSVRGGQKAAGLYIRQPGCRRITGGSALFFLDQGLWWLNKRRSKTEKGGESNKL